MPTYEYQCKACGREFEYQQRMSDPDLTACEACGQDKLEKLISRTAFQLKGGGWYKDLYASTPSNGGKSAAGAAKPASADTASSSAGSDAGASSGGASAGSDASPSSSSASGS